MIFKKTEQFFYYLFFFSIPLQTRKILWYDGWRFNEWLSISVYFTDVLFGILFLFWLFNSRDKIVNFFCKIRDREGKMIIKIINYSTLTKPDFWLVIFILFSVLSIKNSNSIAVSWFQWFKLVE